MRKTFQKLTLLMVALLSSVAASAQTFDVGDLRYTVLSGTENVKVEAVNKSTISGALVIPATVVNEGTTYKVTEIAEWGFNYAYNITSITFEGNNLVTIGRSAFKDTQGVAGEGSTVTIPASVKVIDYEAFCRCYAEAFVFAAGSQLERLGATNGDGDVFWQCQITQMPNLPNTITKFGDDNFKYCRQLTSATLPSNLTEIPKGTFTGCTVLAEVTFPANITKIGDEAFSDCDALTEITIPASVTKIGRAAFYGCDNLTSASMSDNVTEMGNEVFRYCYKLASAKFSKGMTTVPGWTFDQCQAMASITGIDNVTRLEIAAFGNCRGFTSFTIPAKVEYIGEYALGDLHNCESYTFAGNNVTEIYNLAFQHNLKLTSFTMPNSVTTVGENIFYDCPLLADITLSNQLTELPAAIFKNNKSITSFTIPANIKKIGNQAFYGTNLTSIVIPDGVTLGTEVFRGCTELTSVTLPAGITEIPNYTFCECSKLTGKFTIPATVTRIGEEAFCYADGIEEIEFEEGSQLVEIGREAFYMHEAKTQLSRFIMPNTVTTMGYGVFHHCKKLNENGFHFSTAMTTVPDYTFSNCGFTDFDFETYYDLGIYAFSTNLFTELHLPANIDLGRYGTFKDCQNLERVYFADGCTLASMPYETFAGCGRLSYLYLPVATPPSWGGSCFPWFNANNGSIMYLDVPVEAVEAYKADSDWGKFRYPFALNATGTTDLTEETGVWYDWSTYTDGKPDNFQYFQGSNSGTNRLTWIFDNPTEKEYTVLLDVINNYYNDLNNYVKVELVKLNADGTSTTVQTEMCHVYKSMNTNYAPEQGSFHQVYVSFDDALTVGRYQLTLTAVGTTGKRVKDVQLAPTEDLYIVKLGTAPVGAGTVTAEGKFAQPKDATTPLTLTATAGKTQGVADEWITFTNWTVDGEVVSTDAEYTFTPSASAKVVANFTPEYQTIPTAEGEEFNVTHAAIQGDSDTKWYMSEGGNFGWIKNGYNFTYFIDNEKPAIYDFKFMTGIGYNEANDGNLTATIEVIDAEGTVVDTEVQTIAPQAALSWRCTDAYAVRLKPIMPGKYSVRITFNHPTYTYHLCNFGQTEFDLVAIVPETIALDKTEATVKVEFDEQLTATLTPADITEGYEGVAWTSSNTGIATVDQTGKVTAVAPGTAVITAKATGRTDIELAAACNVTVPQHVTDITVPAAQSIYVGDVITLETTVLPENAADKTLTWTSSNTDVATVDATGKVTAVAKGDAVITVTAADRGKLSKTIAVNVKQQVTSISLNQTEVLVHKSEKLQLTATIAPENANDKSLTWTSSNEAVATVDQNGLVTGLANGVATITATANDGRGAKATCDVTVDVPVTSVTLDKTSESVYAGDVVVLTATVNPEDATDKSLIWTSSDEAVATVADGTVTAVAAGTAVITATSNYDATKTATFTLNVINVTVVGTGANTIYFHNTTNNSGLGTNVVAWDNETDKNWVANEIVLTDAEAYTNPYDVEAATLTYKRVFDNEEWQPLYVPFNMAYSEWADKAEVAELTDVHEYENGVVALKFDIIESGEIVANKPYIIRAKSASDELQEFVCEDKILSASPAAGGRVGFTGVDNRYTLTGVYSSTTGLDDAYLMGGNRFNATSSAELDPMRLFLSVTDKASNTPVADAPSQIEIEIDGSIVTGMTVFGKEINKPVDGYNTQGMRVNSNYKGIVIQNGRKVVKK